MNNMINGNELVNLLFLPVTDEKVIMMISRLGLEQPIIDEIYEIEEYVATKTNNNVGVGLRFEEINSLSQDGEPNLVIMYFNKDDKVTLPNALEYEDDYKICCKKLGKKADFYNELTDDNKIWKFNLNGLDYGITIRFKDEELAQIKAVIVHRFRNEEIGDPLLPNKE